VPIFFIILRETVEAAIIVSVLLGLTEQLVHDVNSRVSSSALTESSIGKHESTEDGPLERTRLLKKMRLQVKAI
jgi:high-affinity iron transporter